MGRLAIVKRVSMLNKSVIVLELKGHLDVNTVDEFEEAINDSFKKGFFNIILNFEGLEYVSSAGIGILISLIKEFRKMEGDIRISNVRHNVQNVLNLLGLPEIFHISGTEEEATASFSG